MHTIVIFNPKSGSTPDISEIVKIFSDAGITIDVIIPIENGFEAQLRRVITASSLVAVIGGDGTLSSCVQTISDAGAILLPLPGGTKNNFTKDLSIPQDIREALIGVLEKKIKTIDIASANNHFFVNNSSIGLYPASLVERAKMEHSITKWPAATIGLLKAFLRFRTYRLRINQATYRTPFVFIGNNAYKINNNDIGRRDALDRGTLQVLILNTASRRSALKTLIATALKLNSPGDNLIVLHEKEVTIKSTKRSLSKLRVSFDGEEMLMNLPVKLKIHSKKLRVLA